MNGRNGMIRLTGWLLLSWLLLGSVAASAATKLTEEVIDRWLQSQPELQAWAIRNQKQLEPHESKDEWSDLQSVDNMLHSLKAAGLYDNAAGVMKKYGFAKPEDWADVTIRVIKAFLANELEGREAEVDILKAQLAALEVDPDVPEAKKQAMIAAMKGNLAMVDLVKSSAAADREAVKPHMNKIRNQLNAGRSQ